MNHPKRTARAVTTGPVGTGFLVAQVAFGTAIAGLATGLLGVSVGISTGNPTAGILIRGALTLTLILLISRALGGRAQRAGNPPARAVIIGGALLGFVLDPLTWQARTVLTQLAFDPGAVTLIGDLLLWLSAAGLGGRVDARAVAGPAPVATPYG